MRSVAPHVSAPARWAISLLMALALVAITSGPAWPQPIDKWIQEPDLEPTGIDVSASGPYILADDFACVRTGPITRIAVWGSWLNDHLPFGQDPGALRFILSIHADIPASQSPTGYSMPGETLWMMPFDPGTFDVSMWAENIDEGWMYPPSDYVFPGDHVCWRYEFNIDPLDAFVQQGGPLDPVVYWLDVKAYPQDLSALFGWKTSLMHWNDDAVWGDGDEPYVGPWSELRYPPGHPMAGQSIDLAFLIGTDAIQELDFGDAPDPVYPTLLASDGARHVIVPGIHLGNSVDPEPDGQPDATATGDDNDGNNDDDGIVSTTLLHPGMTASVTFSVSAPGFINGWIDWNQDGTWAGSEKMFSGLVPAGQTTKYFTMPAAALPGTTFGRIRFASAGPLLPTGPAPDGEVEDYLVEVQDPLPHKWLQSPDLDETGLDVDASDPFLLADDFLCTEPGLITGIQIWGSWLDDVIPFNEDPRAMDFMLSIHADIPAEQSPTGYSMPGETLWWRMYPAASFQADLWAQNLLEGWMTPPDQYLWPGDTQCWRYRFDIPPDQAFTQLGTPDNPVVYWLDVKAIPHDPAARFGWKSSVDHWNDDAVWTQGEEPYSGDWGELRYPPTHPFGGQSIDLAFLINGEPVPERDYGDAPDGIGGVIYPTLAMNGGAFHNIVPGVFMGAGVDPEPDGQPDPAALGDDQDILYPPPNDDEDGVVFTTPLTPGNPASMDITCSVPGFLDVWIDFEANASWAEPGNLVYSGPAVSGLNTVNCLVPAGAPVGRTYVRVRFNTAGNVGYFGGAADGEVEDYRVEITPAPELKWEQPPDLGIEGIDVNDSREFILADDFLCTQHGPITEIHVWGSWRNDYLPFQGDPRAVDFVLSFHTDIPAVPGTPEYSRPGELLWMRPFPAGEFTAEVFSIGEEGWMDPPDLYVFPGDFTCWHYVFRVPEADAFFQRGTNEFPRVYWLDVKAYPHDPMATFGWKTSIQHWNDDAVWGLGDEPYAGPWFELRYPFGHPQGGRSIDLAFALYGTIAEPDYDFGDAPEPAVAPGYPTTLANGGANHLIVPGIHMGASVDGEPDGQPDNLALGDDNDIVYPPPNDDEDGVTFTSVIRAGWVATWSIDFTAAGHVDIWLDWNRNFSWADPGEHIGSNPVTAGTNTFAWHVPPAAVPGPTYMRFRFNTAGPLPFTGPAPDGEVEDYRVEILEITGTPGDDAPQNFRLYHSMPNPFASSTRIHFDLPEEADVRLAIYGVDGSRVALLTDERLPAGRHQEAWDGRDAEGRPVAAGTYFYRLEAGTFVQTRRLVVLR